MARGRSNGLRVVVVAMLQLLLAACDPSFDATTADEAVPRDATGIGVYGGDGGAKYSPLTQIDASNVADLEVAWVHRSGHVGTVFQNTPILADGRLLTCTPWNDVIALDPLTGGELWRHTSDVDRDVNYANEGNCRGVAIWRSADELTEAHCAARVLLGTNDARLIALDLRDGSLCEDFGAGGAVDLAAGVGSLRWPGEYQITSPPAVVGNVVVVGSAVSDGGLVEAPSGVVRGYDAVSGELRWAFDLAPPGLDRDSWPLSSAGWALGTPNVWAPISADVDRGLVFLPTGNPSPDYYRQGPEDLDHYGSSVLALRADTGELVWQFRTVIDDFWDFDVPSQPVLTRLTIDGAPRDVVVQATKMGFVFVLDRDTGEPAIPVEYREVPRSGPLAQALSPVQPFPPPGYQLSRDYVPGQSLLGLCDKQDARSVTGPVYTPIGEEWVVGLPSNMGATNWGGVSVDPERGLILVPVSSVPFRTKLIERAGAADLLAVMEDVETTDEARAAAWAAFRSRYDLTDDTEVAPQRGVDYLMARHAYLDDTIGLPCSGTPFGEMAAIDVATGTQRWRVPHGTAQDAAFLPVPVGMPGMGGALATASGLTFMAGGAERAIRAYDSETGDVLWHHRLPNPGNAIPTTYVVETEDGPRQFLVIAAGGDARAGIAGTSDHLVAFALPAP